MSNQFKSIVILAHAFAGSSHLCSNFFELFQEIFMDIFVIAIRIEKSFDMFNRSIFIKEIDSVFFVIFLFLIIKLAESKLFSG